ncbi:MAG: DNA translocase FtsK 4TM domain-containing protein [Bacteroidales bacterium]|nr:DNA translocase FtsK 4TM domain-containing protein [Bacteroidales bacterium]
MSKTKKKKKTVRPTSRFVEFWRTQRCRKLRGSCYILLAAFLAVAMTSFLISWPSRNNWLGALGFHLSRIVIQNTFGIASYGLTFLLVVYGLKLWKKEILPWRKTLWSTLFWMVWVASVLGYCSGKWGKGNTTIENFAGVTGNFIAEECNHLIKWGTLVLFAFIGVVYLVFVHKVHIRPPKVNLTLPNLKSIIPAPAPQQEKTTPPAQPLCDDPSVAKTEPQTDTKITFAIDDEYSRISQRTPSQPSAPAPSPAAQQPAFTIADSLPDDSQHEPDEENDCCEATDVHTPAHYTIDEPYDPRLDLKQYQMPSTLLLTDWETRNVKVTKEELVANKDRIVETLRNYNIDIVEISASPGPTVTLYEIKPAPGIRISKIKSLEDDIALSLSALGIRIIAPIPGKGTVGIEVPNAKPQIVSMKNMLESDTFRNNTMELPVAFGKTISNEPFVTDLAKMPHLLMAGATGTGKSVGLNAVIASLLYKKHPAELKFVMVDPKKVELSLYNKIERHYLAKLPDSDDAIITDVKKVVRTLNSLCIEMDQRYDLLRQAGVRKITEYNDKFIHRHLNPENGHRYLPYIVLIVDEFADLIMTAGKEVEMPICRLAQLARAVGIHLIIATQRPTTNIITGTIKANFPARIAFKVTSGIDSRTILDCSGAQRLIGRGDMLISLSGSDLLRLQCALIETAEIEQLADFIGSQRGYPDGFLLPEYLDENEEPNKDFDPKQKDEFFNDAARLVVASQFGSTSLLQRKLQLGYNRAGRIIDQLEAAGIVGPYNGSKAREVLVHDEVQLEELLRSL